MTDKSTRDAILEAADRLFYQQGFESTSFADVADAVRISRGNFYYYFKTKDEILDAVIGLRLANTRAMLAQWEASAPDPSDRIRQFIRILIANQSKIMRYGCPVGTLCAELAKLDHASLAGANGLFALFRDWLRRQFSLIGDGAHADERAMHLLARSQGIATLATAFRDAEFVENEVREAFAWLDSCVEGTGRAARGRRRANR